jgi:hypothetical protein
MSRSSLLLPPPQVLPSDEAPAITCRLSAASGMCLQSKVSRVVCGRPRQRRAVGESDRTVAQVPRLRGSGVPSSAS